MSFAHAPSAIVDLGANVGYASIAFANMFPRAKVVSVEADSENFRALQRNTASLQNVTCFHAAIWPTSGRVRIDNPGAMSWSRRVAEVKRDSDDEGSVSAITMSELIEQADIDRVSVLKIDINGAEVNLFSEATDWLEKVDVLIIELHDRFVPGSTNIVTRAVTGQLDKCGKLGQNTVFARPGFRPVKSSED